MENHNDYIIKLVNSNFSILPIVEGKKNPHKICLDENNGHNLLYKRATVEEVKKWITAGVNSWATAGGVVSDNLMTLDFDEKHYQGLYDLWYAKLSDNQKKIVDTCHKSSTRNKGTHLRYRTQTTQPTIKLAKRVEFNKEKNKEEIATTAETRGEKSYALIPPSDGYNTIKGDLLNLPVLTDEIHEELIYILRTFNEVEDEPETEYEKKSSDSENMNLPGNRFNKQIIWNEILGPHGWVEEYKDHWRRPGKKQGEGISATTNYDDKPMFYNFSSSASPFKANKGYSKFHVFALLNYSGDFKAAAKVAEEMCPREDNSLVVKNVLENCTTLLKQIPKETPKEFLLRELKPILKILVTEIDTEEANIYIRNRIKNELDISTMDINSILKEFKEMKFDYVVKNTIKKTALQKETAISEIEKLTNEEKKIAENILKSPTLFYDILKMVKKIGVVGEEKNVLLHYIIFTSRKLKQPLSATVKGDSSSGKSYTLLTTIKLFPKSAYIDLTDATPQSFYYCPEDHFKHKIIVIFEKHGGERADYAIRTLQSEGKLKIQVTVKNPENGQFEAQTIEKEGPTGFVTTTTASFIHAENDTRNISMFPDQSSEQTGRIYESIDSKYLGFKQTYDDELKQWHSAQLILEEIPVMIPFVKSFRKYFPIHIIRTRRDYHHFLAIIETVAFLHQKQRKIIKINNQKYIQATLADAYMAKVIVEHSLSKSIYELPEKTIEVIKTAKIFVEKLEEENLPERERKNKSSFTITQISKILGWDRDTISKWIKPAEKKGYVSRAIESKGPKGAEYILETKELPGDSFLPSITDLIADNPNETDIENIYNPITGEKVLFDNNVERVSTDVPITLKKGENTQQEEALSKVIGESVQEAKQPDYAGILDDFINELDLNPTKDEDGLDTSNLPF